MQSNYVLTCILPIISENLIDLITNTIIYWGFNRIFLSTCKIWIMSQISENLKIKLVVGISHVKPSSVIKQIFIVSYNLFDTMHVNCISCWHGISWLVSSPELKSQVCFSDCRLSVMGPFVNFSNFHPLKNSSR